MICKNCGSELIDGLLQCPYCGTEDTKEAVEQQKEYIEEYKDKIEGLKDMPERVAKKGKSKTTNVLIFLMLLSVCMCIVVAIISSLLGGNKLQNQENYLEKLEELYQEKDFDELEAYYKKINMRGGSFTKYSRVIDVYERLYYIDSLKLNYEQVRDYSKPIEEMEYLQEDFGDVFGVLYDVKKFEEQDFPYGEEEGILYLKEIYVDALKEYALLTDEEIEEGILMYVEEEADYSELVEIALQRLNEKFHT